MWLVYLMALILTSALLTECLDKFVTSKLLLPLVPPLPPLPPPEQPPRHAVAAPRNLLAPHGHALLQSTDATCQSKADGESMHLLGGSGVPRYGQVAAGEGGRGGLEGC